MDCFASLAMTWRWHVPDFSVMAGLVPAIHDFTGMRQNNPTVKFSLNAPGKSLI
jgi:hypothetical protein